MLNYKTAMNKANEYLIDNDPFQMHKHIPLDKVSIAIDNKLELLDSIEVLECMFMTGTGE